ncbi:hypothetical protein NL372_30730, partial [Klebsiella pneumoniae]|nr:hypothetical protein [Klebsiella pneumoniae]
ISNQIVLLLLNIVDVVATAGLKKNRTPPDEPPHPSLAPSWVLPLKSLPWITPALRKKVRQAASSPATTGT